MDSLVNHLVQLQELALTRDEHRATGDGSHLDRLNSDIEALAAKLPADACALYQRLYKKDHIVMAPVYNGSCAICGMKLPISQVQAVRLGKELQTCPSCARILFESTSAPQWVGEQYVRTGPRRVGIARFSAETLMAPHMEASTREEAIAVLAEKMSSGRFVDDAAKIVAGALEREAILSTSMDNGLAFPHVRGVEGGGLTLAMGTSLTGIDFGTPQPVFVVCLITIPTAVSAFYLKLMAGLTEAFMKAQNREALLAAETQEELWKALNKATRYTIK
jgi:mannitol/fructose-specific phosphotransferase system IIA component (Ntr-type)